MNYIDEVWLEVIIMGEYLFNLTLSKSTRTIIYTHSRLLKLWFYLPKSSWITPKIALGWNRVQLGRTQSNSFKITSLDRVHEFNSVCNFFFLKTVQTKTKHGPSQKTHMNQTQSGKTRFITIPINLIRSYEAAIEKLRRATMSRWQPTVIHD